MPISITDLWNLLKEDILPVIQNQLFTENLFTAELEKNKQTTFNNNTFNVVATTGQHSWVYSISENWTIEDGNFSTAKMQVPAKFTYGRHTFTDIALEWVEWDEWSIANILTMAWDQLKMAMQREINRQWEYWYWQWTLGTVNTWATWTTVTVDWEANYWHWTHFLAPWMKLLIGTKAEIEGWTADEVTIADVLSDTEFTTTTSFTSVTGDLIVKKQVFDSWSSTYNEMNWFRNLIDNASSPYSSTFQWVNRATNNWVNANVYKNWWTHVEFTIELLRQYVLKASKWGNPNLIMMNYLLYDKYISLLEGNKRFVDVKTASGSFQGVAFAWQNWDIPIVLSYDVPLDEIYIVDNSTFTIGEMAPLGFLDRDWQVLRNVGGTTNQFTAIMKYYGNLINLNPRANARLTDMKATA